MFYWHNNGIYVHCKISSGGQRYGIDIVFKACVICSQGIEYMAHCFFFFFLNVSEIMPLVAFLLQVRTFLFFFFFFFVYRSEFLNRSPFFYRSDSINCILLGFLQNNRLLLIFRFFQIVVMLNKIKTKEN